MGDKEWKPNPTIRERVLGEILQTEKDYVKDLQVIINVSDALCESLRRVTS